MPLILLITAALLFTAIVAAVWIIKHSRMITFKIHYSEDKQFYVTMQGRNGKTIMTSETYSRKQGAHKGIAAVVRYMKKDSYRVVDTTA